MHTQTLPTPSHSFPALDRDLPPLSIDPQQDWWVWVSTRSLRKGFTPWSLMTRAQAQRWGQMRPGAYASMQAFPERPAKGRCRSVLHASLFWLDFDAPDLGESVRAAYRTLAFLDRTVRPVGTDEYDLVTIRYSGNRSIHMGIDLGLAPAPDLTAQYKKLATAWREQGHAPHSDLSIYSQPRLLPVPGSVRVNTGRRVTVLSISELVDGCAWPERIVDASRTP